MSKQRKKFIVTLVKLSYTCLTSATIVSNQRKNIFLKIVSELSDVSFGHLGMPYPRGVHASMVLFIPITALV